MAKLIYSAIASLDGYVADEHGRWDWSVPDEEVHAFVNDLQRHVGTHLLGRRMYEVLVAWETIDDPDPVIRDSRSSGARRTRWCTRGRSRGWRARGRGSSGSSTPRPSGR